ncbi:MAG: head-tail joining protein [Pseudobdellovibrionaceae bacterium]
MTENLDAFFSEFAVDCVKPGGSTVKVLFETPDQELLNSMVIDAGDMIIGKTSDLSDLAQLAAITVDGRSYRVKKVLKIDDGLMSAAYLEAV